MIRALAVFSSLLSVGAFSSAKVSVKSSSLKMGYESAAGAQAPVGFFDPLGQ